jgi:TPR repeat protein
MDGREWVENRSVIAFKSRCDGGNAEACYRLGAMSAHNLGGQHNYLDDVLALYEKACAGKVENACELAQAYRDEKAKREAATSAGSGTGSSGSDAGSAQ